MESTLVRRGEREEVLMRMRGVFKTMMPASVTTLIMSMDCLTNISNVQFHINHVGHV
jgi:hypothetical protein